MLRQRKNITHGTDARGCPSFREMRVVKTGTGLLGQETKRKYLVEENQLHSFFEEKKRSVSSEKILAA